MQMRVISRVIDKKLSDNNTLAIGLGKTSISVIGMAYLLHRLLCLKNPQEYYNLQGNSKIVFTFFNTTMDQHIVKVPLYSNV